MQLIEISDTEKQIQTLQQYGIIREAPNVLDVAVEGIEAYNMMYLTAIQIDSSIKPNYSYIDWNQYQTIDSNQANELLSKIINS